LASEWEKHRIPLIEEHRNLREQVASSRVRKKNTNTTAKK